MIGLHHTIIVAFGVVGLILGGVLVDLDHRGTWSDKWKGFWGLPMEGSCHRGVLHEPLVLLSLSSFFIALGAGLLIHYLGDF